jgi:POT family proton-dependent oligopeptide transporter
MADPAKTKDAIQTEPALPAEPAADGMTTRPSPPAPPVLGVDLAEKLTLHGYRTAPDHETKGWPAGIPYIVGNEVCERFSFYGMKAILFVQLVALYVLVGEVDTRANELARSTIHLFIAGVYALPMIGAIIADRLAGKYNTILYLSLLYCAGHGVLAFVDQVPAAEAKLQLMYIGLALIAIGSGGIKPCVSANVGDQFGKSNWFRVRTVYQIFYFSVNFGSFFSTILIPRTKQSWGAGVAFAIPGILMLIATIIFWLGRNKFVHVPPKPGGKIGVLDTLSSTALFLTIGHLFFTAGQPLWIVLLVSAFFLALGLALFAWRQRLEPDNGFLAVSFYAIGQFFSGRQWDPGTVSTETESEAIQEKPFKAATAGSSWLRHSGFWGPAVARFGTEATEGPVAVLKIVSVFFLISVFWALFDQHASSWIEQAKLMDLRLWGEKKVLENEIQALNPLLVMGLIPLLNVVYWLCDRSGVKTPPLRRITVGMFVAASSFVAAALLQSRIDAEGTGQVWFAWQVIPYLLITIAEVMVAITALEFAYTQAPPRMKSTVMSFLNLTVALGNVLVALLSYFAGLSLVNFFWVFAGLMAAAAVIFGIRGYFYVQKDYTQG